MNLEGLEQRIANVEEDMTDGHKRLRSTLIEHRERLDEQKEQMDRIGAEQRATAHSLELLAQRPVDATKLVLSTKVAVTLIAAAVTIAASYWNLSTKLDAQRQAAEATAKLQEVQMKSLSDAVTEAKAMAAESKKNYELLRYDFQDLTKTVLKKGK